MPNAGTYYPDTVAVPLDAIVVVPDVPAAPPAPKKVPEGLQVGQWLQMWCLLKVTGISPKLRLFADWSPTGWSLPEFTQSAVPLLEITEVGVFNLPKVLDVNGRFLLFRLVGVAGNGLDTLVTLTCGGT